MFLIVATATDFRKLVAQRIDDEFSKIWDFRLTSYRLSFDYHRYLTHVGLSEALEIFAGSWPASASDALNRRLTRSLSLEVRMGSAEWDMVFERRRHILEEKIDLWMFDIQVPSLSLDELAVVVDQSMGAALLGREVSFSTY